MPPIPAIAPHGLAIAPPPPPRAANGLATSPAVLFCVLAAASAGDVPWVCVVAGVVVLAVLAGAGGLEVDVFAAKKWVYP